MENIQSKRESGKAKRKAKLIDAAQKLFIEKGFDSASIDEVARKAGLTKRTLYQYFNSKEDLFFAVTLEGAKQLFLAYEQAMSGGSSALEKISLGNAAYLRFYTENTGMFRLMNYAPANLQSSTASPHYQEIRKLDDKRMKYFMQLVAKGKSDGSINPKLDTTKAVFFAFFSPFSLLYTISSQSMWDRLELDSKEFLEFSFDLFITALR